MKSECNSVWKKVDKLFSSNKKSYIKQNKLYVGNKRRENQRENKCLTWMTPNMEKALFSLSSLGVCFSLIYSCLFSYSSENKLDFTGHPQRIPKPISDQNLFSWFQSCWTVEQKMNSNNKAILEIFYEKESNNLNGREKNSRTKLLNC